ncbi:hypothetical protein C2869_08720 [Saccharobesus litoralis]|uniref:Divergent polysaccharide deacetylase family protein n=1 Tax=Saccharobesus litoralis TaxID=2172099 RepID=A0A2S0VQL2_9ALTE|nr:divergent polysaccharide deacetylase family protein [Saccharobesus litoralis]AWB66505.1 hypothetical protein C2869_08720 [Saccharobesus litoralis]
MTKFCITLLLSFACLFSHAATIAIIIDDVGNSQHDQQVLQLPNEVTISVLAHTPHGKSIAKQAGLANREVMLHLPMEALSGKRLGPGAIVSDMSANAIQQQLLSSLNELPNAVGVNNHMGSKLTQMREPMLALMQSLKKQDLYFVDSRTTKYTVAETVAKEQGVKHYRRHVFLDSIRTEAFVSRQLKYLVQRAKKHGYAVAIGHPYPQTMKVLFNELPKLQSQVKIQRMSQMPLAKQKPSAYAANL